MQCNAMHVAMHATPITHRTQPCQREACGSIKRTSAYIERCPGMSGEGVEGGGGGGIAVLSSVRANTIGTVC